MVWRSPGQEAAGTWCGDLLDRRPLVHGVAISWTGGRWYMVWRSPGQEAAGTWWSVPSKDFMMMMIMMIIIIMIIIIVIIIIIIIII